MAAHEDPTRDAVRAEALSACKAPPLAADSELTGLEHEAASMEAITPPSSQDLFQRVSRTSSLDSDSVPTASSSSSSPPAGETSQVENDYEADFEDGDDKVAADDDGAHEYDEFDDNDDNDDGDM